MYFEIPKLVIMCLLSYLLFINIIYVYVMLSQAREECSWLKHSLPCCLLSSLLRAAPKEVQGTGSPVACVLLCFFHPCLSAE